MATTLEALQFPFDVDRSRGQVRQVVDYERYITQLIRQVLLTAPGERAHRPDFGAGLRRMVFAPNDPATASLLQATIYQNLNQWLGNLLEVNDVQVESQESVLVAIITYTVKSLGTRTVLNLEVTS